MKVTRSGSKVSFFARDYRYFPNLNKWTYYAGWHGQIQYKVPGTTQWKALKDAPLDSTGAYSRSYTNPAVREYRALFPDNSVVWGDTSDVTKL